MSGESQQPPKAEPDPSVLTTQQMLLRVASLEELTEARLDVVAKLGTLGLSSLSRELQIKEAHRLELKADSEKALSTAMIAAEKAVQAALAAAEKARDQQTIASQLATTKSEDASKEQLKQQGETFTLAIRGLTEGQGDIKQGLNELRSERKGSNDSRVALYAFAGFIATLLAIVGFVIAVLKP